MNNAEFENSYKLIIRNLEIYETIYSKSTELFLNRSDIEQLRNEIHKNTILDIYTSWDNYVLNCVYDYYLYNKEKVINAKFIRNIFRVALEKRHIRDAFLKGINDDKIRIDKEILCSTNNLNTKELKHLINLIGLDFLVFEKLINSSTKISKIIIDLDLLGIVPIIVTPGRRNVMEYLDNLVLKRNEVAHSFKISEQYQIEQLKKYSLLFLEVSYVFSDFLGSSLLNYYHSNKVTAGYMEISIRSVIRGCSISQSKNAIIEIICPIDVINIVEESNLFICNVEDTSIFCSIKIKEARNSLKRKVRSIKKDKNYSIEVISDMKIRSGSNYKLLKLNDIATQYFHNIEI